MGGCETKQCRDVHCITTKTAVAPCDIIGLGSVAASTAPQRRLPCPPNGVLMMPQPATSTDARYASAVQKSAHHRRQRSKDAPLHSARCRRSPRQQHSMHTSSKGKRNRAPEDSLTLHNARSVSNSTVAEVKAHGHSTSEDALSTAHVESDATKLEMERLWKLVDCLNRQVETLQSDAAHSSPVSSCPSTAAPDSPVSLSALPRSSSKDGTETSGPARSEERIITAEGEASKIEKSHVWRRPTPAGSLPNLLAPGTPCRPLQRKFTPFAFGCPSITNSP